MTTPDPNFEPPHEVKALLRELGLVPEPQRKYRYYDQEGWALGLTMYPSRHDMRFYEQPCQLVVSIEYPVGIMTLHETISYPYGHGDVMLKRYLENHGFPVVKRLRINRLKALTI